MADGEVLALAQDMTLSRDAFLRSLAAAVGHAAFRAEDADIRPVDPAQPWRIVLTPLSDLRLGQLTLPRQRVQIFLRNCGPEATTKFLERFELYFRRAGG